MVKIAVYRQNESGQIKKIHNIPEAKYSDMSKAARDYNDNSKHDDTVEIIDLKDGSLELFLYNRSELDIKNYHDEIGDMLDRVCDLCTSVDRLHDLATKVKK